MASTDSVTFTAILSKNAKKKKEIVGLVVHAFGTLIKIADFKKALLFPPPPDEPKKEDEPEPDPGTKDSTQTGGGLTRTMAWFIPTILAGVAIVAGVIAILTGWRTYTDDQFGFRFRYPGVEKIEVHSADPLIGTADLKGSPGDMFSKTVTVTASWDRKDDRCGMFMDPNFWSVEPFVFGDMQFLKVANKIIDRGQTGYVAYATVNKEGTWVCLVFSYLPIDTGKPPASLPESEAALFDEVVRTFQWTEQPITDTTPVTIFPIIITLTPSNTPTSTNTFTPTNTATATATFTPTFTPTPSPTFTNTPCIYPYNWPTYTVQPGDTIYAISRWYADLNYTWVDLSLANCKGTSSTIFVGERLFVPREPPPGSISGYIFSDTNKSGFQESPELRLSEVPIELRSLSGVLVAKTYTNNFGEYLLTEIPYGRYRIFQYLVVIRPAQETVQNFGLIPVP